MPTRLSDLVIRDGAFVDKGDNPKAKIMFWKRDPQGDPMADKPTPEQVAKAHADALVAKDTELAKVRKELAEAKAQFAVEIAKLKTAGEKKDPDDGLPAEIRKRLADSDARAVELEKKLAAETDARLTAEFKKRAEAIGDVPGLPAAELGPVLKALAPALAEKVEKALRAGVAQAKENQALLKELGRVGTNPTGDDSAMAKLEVLAVDYAKTNKVDLTVARYEVTKSGEGAKLFREARVAEQEG